MFIGNARAFSKTTALTAPLAPSAGGVVRYPAVFSIHRPARCMIPRPRRAWRRSRSHLHQTTCVSDATTPPARYRLSKYFGPNIRDRSLPK